MHAFLTGQNGSDHSEYICRPSPTGHPKCILYYLFIENWLTCYSVLFGNLELTDIHSVLFIHQELTDMLTVLWLIDVFVFRGGCQESHGVLDRLHVEESLCHIAGGLQPFSCGCG